MNLQARVTTSKPRLIQELQLMTAPVFALPPLPYADSALEPVISARTVQIHYRKHHGGYIDALNRLMTGTPFADLSLTQLMMSIAGQAEHVPIFNNAAQAWNHGFYWRSLSPQGSGTPPPALMMLITSTFGDLDSRREEMIAVAAGLFGSGWVWLVMDGRALNVVKTSNADNPLILNQKPLLTIDVWELAYYLYVQSRRADYVKGLLENIIHWEFAANNLELE